MQKAVEEIVTTVNECCERTLKLMERGKESANANAKGDVAIPAGRNKEDEFNKLQVLNKGVLEDNSANGNSPADGNAVVNREPEVVYSPTANRAAPDDVKLNFSGLSEIKPTPQKGGESQRNSVFKKEA